MICHSIQPGIGVQYLQNVPPEEVTTSGEVWTQLFKCLLLVICGIIAQVWNAQGSEGARDGGGGLDQPE